MCDHGVVSKNGINYAFDDIPGMGETMPVAPGIHWLRMPLPFALNHINLWLLEDGDGWIVVDTGLGGEDSKAVWENVFTGTMQGGSVNHVVVTHMHPDHVGCAGWLTDRFDVDLWMTRAEYLLCRVLVADTGRDAPGEGIEFYTAAGFPPEAIERYTKIFGFFGRMVEPLPESFKRLSAGFRAPIGDSEWQVIVGRGHSPEHACLFNQRLNVLISGDQVLPTISSNVSVYPTEPEANPLQGWLESLAEIKPQLPEDVLVLPAHGKPFHGAHARIDQLIGDHKRQLDALLEYCEQARRAIDVFPALYKSKISDSNLIMATGEAIAHLHYLEYKGDIDSEIDKSGVRWYRRA